MPIKSFELVAIDAKRFSKLGERIAQLRVDHNTAVTGVSALSERDVQLDFRFTVSYVGVGVIKIEGKVVWDGEAKEIASNWSKTNVLPNEVFTPVLQAIFTNCLPAVVVTARDLALPPPIPPPQVQGGAKPAKAGAKDTRSMEVA